MSDHDLEATLRRYRPAAAPAALRERVLGDAGRSVWPWLGVAAALLAVVVWTNTAIRAEVQAVTQAVPGEDDALRAQLLDLVAGDESARLMVMARLADQAARRALEPQSPALDLDGEGR